MEENYSTFREMNKTAFILGHTGETGKALVKSLVDKQIFEKIILFGRRVVSFPEEEKYKCLEQKTIDYENLDANQEDFRGCEVGYCCLGTTKGKAGKDGFYKVDHDYVVNAAKLAKDTGCKQFHLVSSQGANENSWVFYTKVKGQVENEIRAMDFEKCAVYRPAMLVCDREEKRSGEGFIMCITKPLRWAAPTLISIPTTTLAMGMVNYTVTPTENKYKILNNGEIFRMASEI